MTEGRRAHVASLPDNTVRIVCAFRRSCARVWRRHCLDRGLLSFTVTDMIWCQGGFDAQVSTLSTRERLSRDGTSTHRPGNLPATQFAQVLPLSPRWRGGAESWAVARNGNAIFGMGRSSGLTPVMATQNRPRGDTVGCARVQD